MEFTSHLRKIMIATSLCVLLCTKEASSGLSTCGGTLIGRTGTFTSPNYPHSPKREPEIAAVGSLLPEEEIITCEWKITVPEGLGIQLNFGEFDMAAGQDECGKGELEVFSGIEENKRSLDKYCGSDELDTVQLTTNTATVVFRRPKEFSGQGFLVSYIATEPGVTLADFVTCVDRGSDHVGVGSYSVLCPGGCANITDMTVRGADGYRDDSYLCKAAVHAGVISDNFGGRIFVKKVPGEMLYMASDANGVTTEAGSMSPTKIQFVRPDEKCKDQIEFHENQLTASSFWTKDPKDPEKTKWKPDKAILGKQIESWSPNNPKVEQWLQVDLKYPRILTAILTRGSADKFYRSKSYRIAYRNDTSSPWTFYREVGLDHDKVFVGNHHTFKQTRNNFVKPRIVGRFIRVYPTPVASESLRYAMQISFLGCDFENTSPPEDQSNPPMEPPVVPPKEETTSQKTTQSTSSSSATSTTIKPAVNVDEIKAREGNTTAREGTTKTPPLEVEDQVTGVVVKSEDTPTDTKKPTMNENSIIVIAIVAALAVTSILLAALVLILVRKRRKEPKDGPVASHPLQPIPDNNNTRFYYKSKKSRKRSHKNAGEHFQNADYKDTLLQASVPQNTMGMGGCQGVTLPADQAQFIKSGSQNGTMPSFLPNGVLPQHNSFHPPDETDSFITDDDEDHEYQVIDDEHVVNAGKTPVPSMGLGSSKASTGSSLGNRSRKSETLQQSWGIDGNQWIKSVPYKPGSPIFPVQEHHVNNQPRMMSFSSNPPPNGGIQYTANPQLTRNATFSHPGGEPPIHPPNLRRGNSQSPSHMQRHSSSSNNSSHSYPPNGVFPYPHDPNNPYYSSVPNGEGNAVVLNHTMYGGKVVQEQGPVSATKRAPSYKVPRQFSVDLPALPDKVGHSMATVQPDVSIGTPGLRTSPTIRSDYDRLYRNNSSGGPMENKNSFSVFNGSHSQYNQLNLNSANV